MEIRYINKLDDKNEISKIYEEGWKFVYRGIISQDYLASIPKGKWVDFLNTKGVYTMVCIKDGKYIGASSFGKSTIKRYSNLGEVITIYLLPDYIGKGYGKHLLLAVLDELQKQGFSEVFILVFKENSRARKFYEKFGFFCKDNNLKFKIGNEEIKTVRYVYSFVQK